MPKLITEDLQGYQFAVQHAEVPRLDEGGQPMVNGDGPLLERQIILAFVEKGPHGERHAVQVRLSETARDELVSMLTGGIYVASQLPES